MKLNMISARVLAAGVASFGMLAGVLVAANPASAASPSHLCLNNVTFDRCIYASGPNGAELANSSTPGMTNWTYPATANGPAAPIQQVHANVCLQLDYSKKDPSGMPTVIGAPCVNDDAEKWVNVYNPTLKKTQFESYWAIKNLGGPQCLYGDPSINQLAIYDCEGGQVGALEGFSS